MSTHSRNKSISIRPKLLHRHTKSEDTARNNENNWNHRDDIILSTSGNADGIGQTDNLLTNQLTVSQFSDQSICWLD